MVATKAEAKDYISSMSDVEFSYLCDFINTNLLKTESRKAAEKRLVSEVKAAEKSVAEGNYVTLSELKASLGV